MARGRGSDPAVAGPPERLHAASMPNLLVRDLPDDVHAELQRRAQRHGKSLQQYLTDELARLVAPPELDEVLHRLERRRGAPLGLPHAPHDLAGHRRRWCPAPTRRASPTPGPPPSPTLRPPRRR